MGCWLTRHLPWRCITVLELHIGRLRFCFGFSFFLLLAVVCRWQAGSMLLLSFLAILLHEIGHLLAIICAGILFCKTNAGKRI